MFLPEYFDLDQPLARLKYVWQFYHLKLITLPPRDG